jgi:hypothetical protein
MTDHGVLLRPELVRAFLAGHKTVTRRTDLKKWRRAKPGDRIWFRETHANLALDGYEPVWVYFADGPLSDGETGAELPPGVKWTPSLLMPKVACRCWAEIEDVREEHLQDMGLAEAFLEGCPSEIAGADGDVASAHNWFVETWNSAYSKKPGLSWTDNPVGARIQFRRIEIPGGGS